MRIGAPPPPSLASIERLLASQSVRPAAGNLTRELVEPIAPTLPQVPVVQTGTSVQMLIAIAASSPDALRRLASASAEKGLGFLNRLDRRLRMGEPTGDTLRELADWAAIHDVPADPTAARLVHEVELRVLVELARHTPAH